MGPVTSRYRKRAAFVVLGKQAFGLSGTLIETKYDMIDWARIKP